MTAIILTKVRAIAFAGASALVLATAPALAQDNEFAEPLTALAKGHLREVAQNALLVAAITAQNATTAAYDQSKIDALDQQWRAEVSAESKPLIDTTLGTDASKWLEGVQAQSGGLFTEIFVMDARGLNVAQSTVTSDYWQGDEDKWQQTFQAGADAIHLGEVEQDESTQAFQSQVSITITDPATGAPIGAITVGVDLASL